MLLWRFWKVVFVCYINWVIQICRTNLCENCVINFASCYINLEFLAEPIWNWCIWSALTTWFVIEEYKHESNMHRSLCRSLVFVQEEFVTFCYTSRKSTLFLLFTSLKVVIIHLNIPYIHTVFELQLNTSKLMFQQ